jgi:hypothetical protein
MRCESMGCEQLIRDVELARNALKVKGLKPVEECLPLYKDILVAAYKGQLVADSRYPNSAINELWTARYLRNAQYVTETGRDFVEKEVLVIKCDYNPLIKADAAPEKS